MKRNLIDNDSLDPNSSSKKKKNENQNQENVPILLGDYTAKLTDSDQIILQLLRTYEKKGKIDLTKYYPLVWGENGRERYATLKQLGPALWNRPTPDEVLTYLDKDLMFESCRRLPIGIMANLASPQHFDYAECYDPRFLLPLFHNLLASNSVINCRRFVIEKSCLAYTFCCLALDDPILRAIAYGVISRLRDHLRALNSDPKMKWKFREKPQIIYILNLLRQSIDKPLVQIPFLSAMFLSQAVYLTSVPIHDVYSTVNGYLLRKPKLDLWDVPEFYKLFQSDSIISRYWILKLMADGLKESNDYRICERRNAFRLSMTFYDWASANDVEPKSRKQVLRLLRAACRIGSAASDLCFRYNLIGWLAGAINLIRHEDEADDLAGILAPIFKNVVEKENTPEYVKSSWYGTALTLKEKMIGMEKNVEEKSVDKKSRKEFRRCLTRINFDEEECRLKLIVG